MAMDIEQFYDEDPRRRSSEETEFGRDWSDGSGVRSELSWVADTGELYVMKEPDAPIDMDPVGDEFVESLDTNVMTVEVPRHRRGPCQPSTSSSTAGRTRW